MSRLPLQKTSHKKAQNTPHLFCELRAFLWLNSFSLKREPQSKLDLPRRRRRIDDASGRAVSCACGSRKNRRDHVAEIRMIEQIERFRAELQVRAFRKIELLFHREVEVRESWADHRILRQ